MSVLLAIKLLISGHLLERMNEWMDERNSFRNKILIIYRF